MFAVFCAGGVGGGYMVFGVWVGGGEGAKKVRVGEGAGEGVGHTVVVSVVGKGVTDGGWSVEIDDVGVEIGC